MNEWYPIVNFEDYEITKCGRIRKKSNLREFIFTYDKDGYMKTALRKDGKRSYFRVHRLVALNFIDNPDNLPLVNHKNGIKDDNRLDNLEWSTHKDNVVHGFEVLGRVGNNGGMNKKVAKVNPKSGEILEVYNSMSEASKANGFKGVSINHVINGRHQTAGGFKWVLIE